jgi:hypothetical protein
MTIISPIVTITHLHTGKPVDPRIADAFPALRGVEGAVYIPDDEPMTAEDWIGIVGEDAVCQFQQRVASLRG